jgi:uncharacterized protein (UPF0335 family)
MAKTLDEPMDDVLGENSRRELAGYIERIETLEQEKAEVVARIKSEMEHASGAGFEKKAIRQIIKERAADAQKSIEQRTIVETYRQALGSLTGTPLGDWARGWLANDARVKNKDKAPPVFNEFMAGRAKKSDTPS